MMQLVMWLTSTVTLWQIVPGTSKEATAEQLEAFNNALVVDDSYVDADDTAPTFGAKNGLTLKDMEGLAYDDAISGISCWIS